jgi:FMN-dependent NADH-azoreductase
MKTLLQIDASANTKGSLSRALTAGFAEDWLASDPENRVLYRDLNSDPVPVVTSDLLEAVYAPQGADLNERKQSALAVSNLLVDEFLAADAFVFGVPMYNFTVPGSFKAYIDQVVRMGRTVGRGPKGLEGLVKGKKMLIIATRSGDYSKGGPREDWDFHEPYLRRVFGWMGIDDITYLAVINNAAHGDQHRRIEEAQEALQVTAERWLAEFDAVHGPGDALKGLAA